ncbi:MAG: NAD(P)-dependent oxidoreductase, partial [Thiovulaceae bacterium]|nr:NAD(P)-dependent oxidoreductase [Sulfurimonadaceae bacterium]
MHNVLVTGANGQLGSEIIELSSGYENNYFFTDRTKLDISNIELVKDYIESNNIDVIINCAAYTAVDKAEDDKESADKINHVAVKNLSEIAKEKNINLIHISTDYVFDGKNYKP